MSTRGNPRRRLLAGAAVAGLAVGCFTLGRATGDGAVFAACARAASSVERGAAGAARPWMIFGRTSICRTPRR